MKPFSGRRARVMAVTRPTPGTPDPVICMPAWRWPWGVRSRKRDGREVTLDHFANNPTQIYRLLLTKDFFDQTQPVGALKRVAALLG
jgi:hypothetical protein